MMPIVNDTKEAVDAEPQEPQHENEQGSETETETAARLWVVSQLPGPPVTCESCDGTLHAHGYRGLYGWSHAEKSCVAFDEGWSAWSLTWAGKLAGRHDGEVGLLGKRNIPNPAWSNDTRIVLIRDKSPRSSFDIISIEDDHPNAVWLWEAQGKSIFLQSDGYLRINGKGSVIADASLPIYLDFGPGFLAKEIFESRVAKVLDTRSVGSDLWIKCLWLSHDSFIEEITGCKPKLSTSQESSPTSMTSSLLPETTASVQPR